jgi:HSP20 family protein
MRELHRLLVASESRELADEIAHLFDDISRAVGRHLAPGETTPALDVLETESAVEIEIDVPGVALDELRVVIKNGVVIIAGEKLPRDSSQRAEGSFHLVERGFGHFARAVRLTGAFDGAAAHATLLGGELRIVIPKMRERRGGEIVVPIVHQDAQEVAASRPGAGTPPDRA